MYKFKNILKKYINKKILIISASVIFIIIATISMLLNQISYALIENNFNQYTGLKLELKNPKTVLDKNLNITSKINQVNVYDKNKKIKFISAQNVTISIKPFSLLLNKLNFKELSAKNIDIEIKQNENGEIDLIKNLNLENIKKLQNHKFDLTRLISHLENTTLNFESKYKTDAKIKANLDKTNIVLSKKQKTLKLSQTGTIETTINNSKNKSDINVNIRSNWPNVNLNGNKSSIEADISNFNLFIFKSLAKKYISKDIENTSGIANLKISKNDKNLHKLSLSINNPSITTKNKIISPYKKIDIETLFGFKKSNLNLENLTIKSNDLDVLANGTIQKPFSNSPNANVEAEITNTQINNFIYFLPDNLIFYNPKGIPTLKNSNLFGIMNGKINIKTNPLNMTGNLKTSNIYIPHYPKSSKSNDVTAVFMKDKVHIYTRIFTPENEFVTINGTTNLDNTLYGQYDVKSTPKINLKFAQLYLIPLQKIIGFDLGPIPIIDMTGYGNIDIKTKGTIQDAQIFGTFSANNATAKLEGLDAKLTNTNCKLFFDNRNIIFKEIKGKLDKADFHLSGIGNSKGDIDVNIRLKNSKTSKIIQILKSDVFSKQYDFIINKIAAASGDLDCNLNLKGTVKDFENKNFFNELVPNGTVYLKNNKIILINKFLIDKLNGDIGFGDKQKGDLKFKLGNSEIKAGFKSADSLNKINKNGLINIESRLSSEKLRFKDIINDSPVNFDFNATFDIKSAGKISLHKLDLSKLKNTGYIKCLNDEKSDIVFNNSIIKLYDNKIHFNKFGAELYDGSIDFNGTISNYLTKNPQGNLIVQLNNINLEKINGLIPKIKLQNSIINNGIITFKNDIIKLESANINYQATPVFLDAQIKNIFSKKILNANLSTILTEQTADDVINPYLISPLKIKGEIPLKLTFKGESENYSVLFSAKIPNDSDISYGGANLGDIDQDREFSGKIDVAHNIANIQNLRIIKYIKNQNNKIYPLTLIKADGKVIQKNNDIYFNNFKVITNAATNVRLLNLIFKKSILKKGNFECNIIANGNSKNPKITGKAFLQDLDLPLYDTKINEIKLNLNNKIIESEFIAKSKLSDIKINLKLENNLELPLKVEKIDISSNKIDIIEAIKNSQANTSTSDITLKQGFLTPNDFEIKDGSFNFKEIQYDKVNAQNIKGNFTYKNNILDFKNVLLDIAKGNIETEGTFNIKSSKLMLNAKIKDCEANNLTAEFLNLSNQLYGKINGFVKLSASLRNSPDAIKKMKSEINFTINDGKMPKLGSLEYLLRAGNLLKNGLFGLSLNNFIQILTPYKTGDFEKITGKLEILDAEIKNLEIISKGKNLSLYMEGDYSILENFANADIYGKLSQNITNALGKVGNASISQFFNTISNLTGKVINNNNFNEKFDKIPSVEGESSTPRYFKVKVLGDINKDNYIKSFSWE